MDCPICTLQFDAEVRIPRILTACGHTVCQVCLEALLSEGGVVCPQCRRSSPAESVAKLPINLALVQLQGKDGGEEVCGKHGKQLEAFCVTDRTIVCVSCILEDDHKKHDVIAVQKAASKERDRLTGVLNTAQQTEQTLLKLENDLRGIAESLQTEYQRTKEDFEDMFSQMRSMIIEREAIILEKLKSTLETEVTTTRQREFQSKKHMYLVQTLKTEVAKVAHETDLQVLRKVQDREAVIKAACAKPQPIPMTRPFAAYNKEVELNGLWKVVKTLGIKGTKPVQNAVSAPVKRPQPPLALANAVFSKELRKGPPAKPQTKEESGMGFQEPKPAEKSVKRAQTIKVTVKDDSPMSGSPLSKGQKPDLKKAGSFHQETALQRSRLWSEDDGLSGKSIDLASLCRPPAAFIYSIGGFSDSGLLSVERYDCSRDEWSFVASSLTNRTQFGSVLVNGKVVAFGGKTAGKRVSASEDYVLAEDRWVQGSLQLTSPRSGFACVAIASDLYVVGGTDGVPLKKMEMWNGEEWMALASMRHRRDELAAVLGPDLQIYAIGGYGGADMTCQRSAERFNISDNAWEQVGSLSSPRRALAAVALPDGVYALGGYDGNKYLNSVEKLDINRGQWVELAPMKYPRCTLAAVSSPDCQFIYALGGFNGSALNVVERYSIVEDSWTEVAPMSEARFMHSCVIHSDS